MDIVLDPIDGIKLLSHSKPDSISVAAIAPRGTMWAPHPAIYMDKIVVDREVAKYLVPECIDAPAAWTLALVARAKQKPVKDLVVFVLDRPRHNDLIEEIRSAGARVLLRSDGDIAGALMAASRDVRVDLMMGIGGVSEGVIAACAIKSLRGGMLGRLAPQSSAELNSIREAGLDITKILSCDELIRSNEVVFSITGITDGVLLSGVSYFGNYANTETLFLRCETGTKRTIHTEYLLD
jgi:fructose-1,6-bisphosphatase II